MRGRRCLCTSVRRNEIGVQLWLDRQLNRAEVEEERQFSSTGQAGVGLAQLVEEGMRTCLQRRQSGHGCVFQQSRAEGNGLWWGTRLKDLCPRVCFDLWEFKLCVVRVHLTDLLPRWCPQNLDDLY